jgi:hypothetical protein
LAYEPAMLPSQMASLEPFPSRLWQLSDERREALI